MALATVRRDYFMLEVWIFHALAHGIQHPHRVAADVKADKSVGRAK
jgi:hypothetical protein